MGKFENILIFSDIDGTYLGNGRRTVPRNEEAVRYFQSEGGLFTFATGRMEYTLLNAIPNLADLVSFPPLINNGTALYDYVNNVYEMPQPMERDSVRPMLEFAEKYYPEVGIRGSIYGFYLYAVENPRIMRDMSSVPTHTKKLPYAEWENLDLYKIVFRADPDTLIRMQKDLYETFGDRYEIILSEIEILEIQKRGVSKGSAINRVRERFRAEGNPKKIVCIGDYENDLEMLRAADFAACPSNAIDSVKAISNVSLCHCSDGAVADLIAYLEAHPELL